MIAGGASFAPRRWSFPELPQVARMMSACVSTALSSAARKTRNWAFSWGVRPGSRRFVPVSVESDQLLCLPDPLIPA